MSFIMRPARFAGGYIIKGSALPEGSGDYLSRTSSTTRSSARISTIDIVVKRVKLATRQFMLYQQANGNTENAIVLEFDANDKLHLKLFQVDSSTVRIERHTTQVFRDVSAWMDIHIAFNTGLTTDASCKIHVNGTEITAFDTKTNPDTARDHGFLNSSKPLYWFGNAGSLSAYPYTARAFVQDGVFGVPGDVSETTDDGFYQINDASGLTFGNNGFLLEGSNGLSNYPIATADMTGASAPSGDVTSSHAESGEPNWYAFDQNASTYWGVSGQSGVATLTYQFDSPKTIAAYNLQNRSGGTSGGPVAFKIQGSNNGSDFTDLHSVTGQSYSAGEKKGYTFSNSTAYSYYRLNISASNSNEGPTIAEWEMFETQDTSGNGHGFIKTGTITATNDSPTNGDA